MFDDDGISCEWQQKLIKKLVLTVDIYMAELFVETYLSLTLYSKLELNI